MRTYLILFLFGSVMLTGCADDLMGPTMDASGITDPVTMRDAAPPTFFKAWEAPNLPDAYMMSFRHTERRNQPSEVDDARLSFEGYGAYNPKHAFSTSDASENRTGFLISGNVAPNRYVSFVITNDLGKVIAEAKGQADELYTRLEIDLDFADGSSQHVVLSPSENGISAP